MKRLLMALTIAAFGLVYSGTAEAFTRNTTGTINITGTLLASCAVTTAPLDFGSFTGTSILHVNTTITVNCSSGVPYRIDLDGGQNLLSTTDSRRIKTGTAAANNANTLAYSLNKTTTWSTVGGDWGDNGATFCSTCTTPPTGKAGTGIGADEVHTVYGTLPTTTNPAGIYSDTVTVTVNY